jgi:uncharacterized membrane protein YdjX (TVP38/TMEM64 family)
MGRHVAGGPDRARESASGPRVRRLARWIPVLLILAGFVLALAFRLDRSLSLDALRDNRLWLAGQVGAHPVASALIYMGIYALVVALSVPGALVLTLAGGFLFGTVLGAALVVVAATLGASLVFLAARGALAPLLRRRADGFIGRMEAGFRADAFNYLLVLRLIPVFPFWLVNLVPAFLGVRLATFVAATALGIIPGSVVFASLGSGLGAIFERGGRPDLRIFADPAVIGPLVGLALLALAPVAYRRWLRGRRPPGDPPASDIERPQG